MGVHFFYNHEKTLKMHFTLAKTLIKKRYKQIKLYMVGHFFNPSQDVIT